MNIFKRIKELVKVEKNYTVKILKELMVIEKNKMYCDLKYSSLYNYIIKELGYSDAESTIRVNAVRLMIKSQSAVKKIEEGSLTLTNAAEANRVVAKIEATSDKEKAIKIEMLVDTAASTTKREFKNHIAKEFSEIRRETLHLSEFMIEKFDRLRKKYGQDKSSYELLDMLLEKELKGPVAPQRVRNVTAKVIRSIPLAVKHKVHTGCCASCGVMSNLEYDHKIKFALGGKNDVTNIQILCRSCNMRKEIVYRHAIRA